MSTRTDAFLAWLAVHGPATKQQIERAGFYSAFQGKQRARLLKVGAVVAFEAANEESEGRYARTHCLHYRRGECDYTPQRGRPRKATASIEDVA